MPTPVARRTVAASGVRAAATWARRTPTAYHPVRARETPRAATADPPRRCGSQGARRGAAATAEVVATRPSRRRRAAVHLAAAECRHARGVERHQCGECGGAGRAGQPPALAPSSTSRPRVEAIVATLSGPCFGARS